MSYDPARHHRRSIRLKGYDYTQAGAYFVTICTQDHACLFGEVVDGEMVLSEYGQAVDRCWQAIPRYFPQAELDEWVVMPNHVHGIIRILDDGDDNCVGATHASPLQETTQPRGPKPGSLGATIGSFKSAATKQINQTRGTPGAAVWQRNYYEHIVRNEQALERIREYIGTNPERWQDDPANPNRRSGSGPARPERYYWDA